MGNNRPMFVLGGWIELGPLDVSAGGENRVASATSGFGQVFGQVRAKSLRSRVPLAGTSRYGPTAQRTWQGCLCQAKQVGRLRVQASLPGAVRGHSSWASSPVLDAVVFPGAARLVS